MPHEIDGVTIATPSEADKLAAEAKAARKKAKSDPQPPARVAPMSTVDVMQGVTVNWLALVFGRDKRTIQRKLADAGVKAKGVQGQSHLYDLPEAAAALVDPVVDVTSYLQNLKPHELPPMIQAVFWDAQLKRIKYEEEAGQLFRAERVMMSFHAVFKSLRDSVIGLTEKLERLGVPHDTAQAMVDDILAEMSATVRKIGEEDISETILNEMAEAEEALRMTAADFAGAGAADDD